MAKAIDINKFLPPAARKLRKLTAQRTKAQSDRRKKKRIGIKELNQFGADQLLSENREALTKAPDKRSAFTKFLDIIDVPRNLVANAVAKIAGIQPKEQREGALVKKVWASDILEGLGMKKGVGRAVIGFLGDVALDPLTYAGAGAMTAKKLVAGAPKVMPKGMKALQATAQAVSRGNLAGINAGVAKALGWTPQRMMKIGQNLTKKGLKEGWSKGKIQRQIQKRLMNKRGGIFSDQLKRRVTGKSGLDAAKDAQELFVKFGEKGRTLARVPFAKTGFITAKIGKRARLYKKFAKGVQGDLIEDIAGRGLRGAAKAGAFKNTMEAAGKVRAQQASKTVAETGAAIKASQRIRDAKRTMKAILQSKKPDMKELKRLNRIIKGKGQLPKAQIKQMIQRGSSVTSKQASRDLRRLDQATEAARRAGKVIPLKRIQSEAKTRKILRGILSKEARAVEAQKGKFGAKAAEFGAEASKQEALSLGRQFDPKASSVLKGATEATYGKLHTTDPNILPGGNTYMNRLRVDAGRMKQRLFGSGHSELGARVAGAEAGYRVRGPAAEVMTTSAWTKEMEPIVVALAQRSGQSLDDVRHGLLALLDVPDVARVVPEDQVRSIIAAITPHMDDASRQVIEKYKALHGGIKQSLDARGIAPGSLEPYVPRRVTQKFAQESGRHVQRTLQETGFSANRTKNLRWTNPVTGKVESALTSNADEVARIKELASQFPDSPKPTELDISIRRFNAEPEIAKSLLPPGRRGAVPQFKETIPEAAGSLVRQGAQLEALGDVADIVRTTGIDADMLAKNPNQFPGFAQFRGGQYANSPAYQTMFKQFEGKAYPQQIIDVMERFMDLSQSPQEIRRFWRMSDTTLNLWKGLTLLHPAYSMRNGVQNLLGNLMAGQRMGPYIKQARPGSQMHSAVKGILSGKPVAGTILTNGKPMQLQWFVDMGRKLNYVGSGQMSQLPFWSHSKSKFIKSAAGAPLRKWFAFNNQMESTMKMASFWGFLDQGMDVQQAAQAVARAMPDLSDLTNFERNIARRLIPFYSWMRKNGALQLFHYLPEKPALIAGGGKLKAAVEKGFGGGNVVPEALRPKWMQDQQAVQVGGDGEKGTTFLLASWLPFQELVKLGSGATDIDSAIRGGVEVMRPSIRFLGERATGQDVFRQAPVHPLKTSDIPGAIPKALIGRGPLGPIMGVRPLREAFRVGEVAEAGGVGAGVSRTLIGGALQPVSKVRGLGAEYQRLKGLAIELRSQINRALQVNDIPQAEQLKRQYLQALIEMHQMGLPGVPQATQQMFQQAGVQAGAPAFEGR